MNSALRASAFVAAVALTGCGGAHGSGDATEKALTRTLRSKVYIESSASTNAGNVLQMMLRRLDAKSAALADSYEDSVALIVAPARDDTVVAVRPLFPGKQATLAVEGSEDDRVVAYFFFTTPGSNWRVVLPRPLPPEVRLELGPNQVERVDSRR